jgi:hypothetical protein
MELAIVFIVNLLTKMIVVKYVKNIYVNYAAAAISDGVINVWKHTIVIKQYSLIILFKK